MDPTKLEMLDNFEKTKPGHKYSPKNSNVRAIISGRDWSKKSILIYGSQSSKEAREHIKSIINRVDSIDHKIELIEKPEVTNIAIGGDLSMPLRLEQLSTKIAEQGIDVEYEPEQFPAVIVKIERPSVTVLLFSTGKFVIQGIQYMDDIEPAIERIQSLI